MTLELAEAVADLGVSNSRMGVSNTHVGVSNTHPDVSNTIPSVSNIRMGVSNTFGAPWSSPRPLPISTWYFSLQDFLLVLHSRA